MLSGCHLCFIYIGWFRLVLQYHLYFTLLNSAFNCCVIWCYYQLLFLVHVHRSLPLLLSVQCIVTC
jgi:hypothetical protein